MNEFPLFTDWWHSLETLGNSILLKSWVNWLHWVHTGALPWGGAGRGGAAPLWTHPFQLPSIHTTLYSLGPFVCTCSSPIVHVTCSAPGSIHIWNVPSTWSVSLVARSWENLLVSWDSSTAPGGCCTSQDAKNSQGKAELTRWEDISEIGQMSCFKAHSLISLKNLLLAMAVDGCSARRVAAVGIIQDEFGLRSQSICVWILSMPCDSSVTLG